MPALHPDIIPRLDPEYVQYYNVNLADKPQLHELPWDPSVRRLPAVAGASKKLAVGLEKDVELLNCKARIFFPVDPASAPNTVWPVFIFFHGGEIYFNFQCYHDNMASICIFSGGWTLGNINSENHFSSMMCMRS